MKRNLLSYVIFFVLIVFSFNINISAATKLTTEDFIYEVNEDGNTLTIVKGNRQITGAEYHVKGQVEIGGKVYRVTCVATSALSSLSVDTLYIDEGIKEVNLSYVLHTKKIVFSATVEKINGFLYHRYSALKSISIHVDNPYLYTENHVIYTKDKKRVIRGNASGKLVLPKEVEIIEANAFSGCTNLYEVIMKDNVRIIKANAFSDCERLKTVRFSTNLTTIQKDAFQNTSCRKIVLGRKVKIIDGLLTKISNIEKVSISKKNPYYKTINSVIYSKNGKTLISGKLVRGTVFVPKKVKKIEESAFEGNLNLVGVVFRGSLKEIPSNCFAYSGLEFVILPKKLKKIGNSSFERCYYMDEITLPNTLQSLGPSALEGCMLKKLTIPKSVRVIGKDALYCSIRTLTFKRATPPKIKKQNQVKAEKYNQEDGNPTLFLQPENNHPGIENVIVPKKSVEKYDKIFDKTMKFKTLDW